MRAYRILLHLYPSFFREEYGSEMRRVFAARLRDADGAAARLAIWADAVADTLFNATRVHLDVTRQDLRATARSLRRTPGFAAAATLITALGVGATTAAFTLADHVLLRPLPFPAPDGLVKIWEGASDRPIGQRSLRGTNDVSPGMYLAWKDTSRSFSAMGAYSVAAANLVGQGEPERLDGVSISVDAIAAVGVAPALGRSLEAADDLDGAPCTILISDALFHGRFGGDRAAIGRRISLDDESCLVAGVMPPGFDFPARNTTFWRPIRLAPELREERRDNFLRVVARLRPGVTLAQAQSEMAAVSAALARMHPTDEIAPAAVIGLRDEVSDQSRLLLVALVGASACLLLIACSNLASLVIARASARARELAVRTALGAGRARLVRQLLTESLALAAVGGALGLAIALATIPIAARLVPTILPIAEVPPASWRMLVAAAFATLGTGLGFGVLPALRATHASHADALRDGARAGTGRTTERTRALLVITQVAISIVLVVTAGLLIRALVRVQSTPAGFDTDHVLTMRTPLSWERYGLQATRAAFYDRVVRDTHALPGVTGVAFTSFLPMTMSGGIWPVVVPGSAGGTEPVGGASSRYVTPEYFAVMRIPIVAGRAFDGTDRPTSQPVAIVSAAFARDYLGGAPAIGRTFRFGPAGERTIVGVVGDVRMRGLERRSEPQVYLPADQQPDNQSLNYLPKDLIVRVDSNRTDALPLAHLAATVRQIIRSADPQQPIADIRPLSAILEGQTADRSVQVRVLGGLAVLSCLLAAVGLHGLLAFLVSMRRREFGVRIALGASPHQVLGLVARRALALGLAGIGIGVVLAYAAGRSLEALLVGVSPGDPVTLAVAIGIALAVTLAGTLMPALRASRTNPRDALQETAG